MCYKHIGLGLSIIPKISARSLKTWKIGQTEDEVIKLFGLGKPRSKLGKWMDSRGMKQEWLVDRSKVSKSTISNVCSDSEYVPSGSSMQKIIKALREIDPTIKAEHFWDL